MEAICPIHKTLCANAFGIPILHAEDSTSLLVNQFPEISLMRNSFDFVKAILKEITVQIQTASDVPSCAPNTPKLAPYTHIL